MAGLLAVLGLANGLHLSHRGFRHVHMGPGLQIIKPHRSRLSIGLLSRVTPEACPSLPTFFRGTQVNLNQNRELCAGTLEFEMSGTASEFVLQSLERMKSRGLRITMPRRLVLQALDESVQPLTVAAVRDRVLESGGHIDTVTVYRILSALQEIGIAHRIGLLDAFAPCRLAHDHQDHQLHAVCEGCGKVIESELTPAQENLATESMIARGFSPERFMSRFLAVAKSAGRCPLRL
ncbi:hypothetical protein CCB81_07135 [Armatimonadetes bacterium Uphvl-Ar2]|nr:hypothetical protein CCB81_07135 [Armatimonadetes bacterium Uphvl-Ar2]